MGAFSDQTAVVTGASSGVGRAIAVGLAAEGATVMLVGRNADRLEQAAAEAGERSLAQRADLTRDEDLRQLAERALGELGGVDILVHAAGIIERGPVASAEVDDLDRQYRTNLRAPYLLTQILLDSLRERGGQVAFVSSNVVANGGPNSSQYAATKSGLGALADSLRAEVNPEGVRVLTLLLGRTATPMQALLHDVEGKPYRPELLIQPDDVAEVVLATLRLPRTAEVTEISMRPMIKHGG